MAEFPSHDQESKDRISSSMPGFSVYRTRLILKNSLIQSGMPASRFLPEEKFVGRMRTRTIWGNAKAGQQRPRPPSTVAKLGHDSVRLPPFRINATFALNVFFMQGALGGLTEFVAVRDPVQITTGPIVAAVHCREMHSRR